MPNITLQTVDDLLLAANQAAAVTALTGILGGAAPVTGKIGPEVLPVTIPQINTASCIAVDPSGTDTARGTALLAAYTAAKLLTPNNAALSASNRATVLLSPGVYALTASLTLNASFVDIIAMAQGLPPSIADDEKNDGFGGAFDAYAPTSVQIVTTSAAVTTLKQSARNVIIKGITVAQLANAPSVGANAFQIEPADANANDQSVYVDCYFYVKTPSDPGAQPQYSTGNCPVISTGSIDGTWVNCTANVSGWRVYGSGEFRGRWENVIGGPYSFMGDASGASMVGVHMKNCHVKGFWIDTAAGFGGCETFAGSIDANCVFEDCTSGNNSFALSQNCAGSFYRCRGGTQSFGSDAENGGNGLFSGYAEDCTAGSNSFGGLPTGTMTGTLVRTTITGNTTTLRLQGGKIRDSRITTTTTGIHALTLLDSNSKISNTDIIVLQGGTGVPIYAASALNVAAYACRMNNASNDANGFHANVTNLVTTPNNVISDSVV